MVFLGRWAVSHERGTPVHPKTNTLNSEQVDHKSIDDIILQGRWRLMYSLPNPPWSRVEGKYLVDFQGMLPDSGSILRGVHFWEVQSALMLSPGWAHLHKQF